MEITQEIIDNSDEQVVMGFDENLHDWLSDLIEYEDIVTTEKEMLDSEGNPAKDEDGNTVMETVTEVVTKYKLKGYTLKPTPQPPTLPLSKINITANTAMEVGNRIWIQKNDPFSLATTCEGLPDGKLMVMFERFVDGQNGYGDVRFIADITNGDITLQGLFEESGNYIITAERLNRGLERIEAPFKLEFNTVEFEVYI